MHTDFIETFSVVYTYITEAIILRLGKNEYKRIQSDYFAP